MPLCRTAAESCGPWAVRILHSRETDRPLFPFEHSRQQLEHVPAGVHVPVHSHARTDTVATVHPTVDAGHVLPALLGPPQSFPVAHWLFAAVAQPARSELVNGHDSAVVPEPVLQSLDGAALRLLDDAAMVGIGPVSESHNSLLATRFSEAFANRLQGTLRGFVPPELPVPEASVHVEGRQCFQDGQHVLGI